MSDPFEGDPPDALEGLKAMVRLPRPRLHITHEGEPLCGTQAIYERKPQTLIDWCAGIVPVGEYEPCSWCVAQLEDRKR